MAGDLAQQTVEAITAVQVNGQQLERDGFVVVRQDETHVLTVGIPDVGLKTQQAWLGIRAICWPRRAFESRRVAVVSSRLGRKLDEQSAWFDAFRTLVCQADSATDTLLTVEGTTAHPFVHRASELFGLPACSVCETDTPANAMLADTDLAASDILVSRPVHELPSFGSVPTADRLLAAFATQVRCIAATKTGNTKTVLMSRLRDEFPVAQVLVANTADCADELVEAGAVSWVLLNSPRPDGERTELPPAVRAYGDPPFENYLLHWTRRPDGAWPDEDNQDYLDKLILGAEASDRSAFATLCRILQQERLIATSALIRGGYDVVCFSDIPLDQLAQRRTYRRHLRRWDYEPYGIAVRKSSLQNLGARPVQYGVASDFDQLAVQQRPYFQARTTADGSVDWQQENEWRYMGSLSLGELTATDLFVFVPTADEASVVEGICDYPVVVLGR